MTLHFAVPLAVAAVVWRKQFWKAAGVMIATMLVDLDHLLARPIFDPCRCSINYHPLHTWPAILFYGVLAAYPRTRWVGVGLLIHMALDQVDCWLM